MRATRRLRGWLLRLLRDRILAAAAGLALLAPAVWLAATDQRWESGVTDGLALIAGATGVAFLMIAAGGRRPDWIDPDDPQGGSGHR